MWKVKSPYDAMTLEAIKEQENSREIQKDTNTEDKEMSSTIWAAH